MHIQFWLKNTYTHTYTHTYTRVHARTQTHVKTHVVVRNWNVTMKYIYIFLSKHKCVTQDNLILRNSCLFAKFAPVWRPAEIAQIPACMLKYLGICHTFACVWRKYRPLLTSNSETLGSSLVLLVRREFVVLDRFARIWIISKFKKLVQILKIYVGPCITYRRRERYSFMREHERNVTWNEVWGGYD